MQTSSQCQWFCNTEPQVEDLNLHSLSIDCGVLQKLGTGQCHKVAQNIFQSYTHNQFGKVCDLRMRTSSKLLVGTLESVNSESTYFLRLGHLLPLEVDTKFSKLNLKVFKEVEESVSQHSWQCILLEALRVHGGVNCSYHSTRDLEEKCAKLEFPIFRVPSRSKNNLILQSYCKLPQEEQSVVQSSSRLIWITSGNHPELISL